MVFDIQYLIRNDTAQIVLRFSCNNLLNPSLTSKEGHARHDQLARVDVAGIFNI